MLTTTIAAAGAVVATATSSNLIDWSPLVPVINLAINTGAALGSTAIPILAYYAWSWLKAHREQIRISNQQALGKQADQILLMGKKFADNGGQMSNVEKIVGGVSDTPVKDDPILFHTAAYAIVQGADTFKALGFDTKTPDGIQAVLSMAKARQQDPVPPPPTTITADVTQH